MNTFCEHHKNSIKFGYRCFDRILLNGLIQPFQQPERVIGFFNAYRQGQRVTRNLLRDIAEQFQNWVKNRCQKWGAPILDAPEGRRDDFVDPIETPPGKQAQCDWTEVGRYQLGDGRRLYVHTSAPSSSLAACLRRSSGKIGNFVALKR
jgi:hypothetical protein